MRRRWMEEKTEDDCDGHQCRIQEWPSSIAPSAGDCAAKHHEDHDDGAAYDLGIYLEGYRLYYLNLSMLRST